MSIYYYNKSKSGEFKNILRNSKNTISVDSTFLLNLYGIQSPSNNEGQMIQYVYNHVRENYPNVKIDVDTMGNIFITKGSLGKNEYYPCLIAHLDEVHEFSKSRYIVKVEDFIFGFDCMEGERCGIGADDKNGIYVALEMLKHIDKLKIVFTVGEEVGLKGTLGLDVSFFNDVAYMLQCDRRGNNNLITKTNGITVTSDDFLNDISDIMHDYNYIEETGTSTDVGGLKKRNVNVSGCNISCGYWNEHQDEELTYLPALENCLNFVYNIINTLGNVQYEHDHKKYVKSYSSGNYSSNSKYYNSRYDFYDDDYYNNYYDDYYGSNYNLNNDSKKTDKVEKEVESNDDFDQCTGCKISCINCPYFK